MDEIQEKVKELKEKLDKKPKMKDRILDLLSFWGIILSIIGLIGVIASTVLFYVGASEINWSNSTFMFLFIGINAMFSFTSIMGGYFQGYTFGEQEDDWIATKKQYEEMMIKDTKIKKRAFLSTNVLILKKVILTILTKLLPVALATVSITIFIAEFVGTKDPRLIFSGLCTIIFTIGGVFMSIIGGYKDTMNHRINIIKTKIARSKEQ